MRRFTTSGSKWRKNWSLSEPAVSSNWSLSEPADSSKSESRATTSAEFENCNNIFIFRIYIQTTSLQITKNIKPVDLWKGIPRIYCKSTSTIRSVGNNCGHPTNVRVKSPTGASIHWRMKEVGNLGRTTSSTCLVVRLNNIYQLGFWAVLFLYHPHKKKIMTI